MKTTRQPKPIYVRCGTVIDDIRRIARDHGYAIAVHGSLRERRDIDLIAAPWTKNAHAKSTLIRALSKLPYLKWNRDWVGKPHGRRGSTFFVLHRAKGCPAYVDLSVMPRAQDGSVVRRRG